MIKAVENLLDNTTESPQTSICILFVLYKSLILLTAFAAPGPGYDTSTQLSGWPNLSGLGKLVRWDAIWYTGLAKDGYRYEQGWAFGWGYTRLLSLAKSFSSHESYNDTVEREALLGVVVAHICHLLCALSIYRLTLVVFRRHEKGERIAFVTACLNVISPAGIFLSSPFAEAPFAFLQLAGYLVYANAHIAGIEGVNPLVKDAQVALSGALFGISCLFRSNGLFNGAIFLIDAVIGGLAFLSHDRSYARIQNLVAIVLGGLLTGAGQVYPQYLAWLEYCTDRNPMEKRPWCSNFPPSVYSYVQDKYWYVGLFRYWSTNSISLFAMAAPMLIMIYRSTWWTWQLCREPISTSSPASGPGFGGGDEQQRLLAGPSRSLSPRLPSSETSPRRRPQRAVDAELLFRLAVPQFVVAMVCVFIANVQIITRLATPYPVWFWWLADWIVRQSSGGGDGDGNGNGNGNSEDCNGGSRRRSRWPGVIVYFCIMYGMIQAGLYAEFLPPA